MIIFLALQMAIRVGINGFGRIGRVIFRTCIQNKDLEITAINDAAVDIEYICYLIKFDSTHGKFKSDVTFSANEITIDDKKIKVFCEKVPSDIPWHCAAVQYVVEASGMFTNLEKASGHLASESVKRVIVTAPTVDIPMLILGVNEEQVNPEQKVISCASSTLYCLALIIKILEDNYGVAEGFITSIHAMTPSLKPLDGLCLKGKHWRDHRSIHQNIIPAATGACKALGKIIPQAKDKMTGLAFRVPIVNVSALDISIRLNKNTTIQSIAQCVEIEMKGNMKNIIKISRDQEVSSDFIGDESSCIFDVNSSLQLNAKFFKLICWYENEYSYACRVVDTIKFSDDNHRNFERMNKTCFGRMIGSRRFTYKRPMPYLNKEYINYNCHMKSSQEVLLSASQEAGLKNKTFKKPLALCKTGSNQLGLQQSEKRNEIFKVWNDEVQTLKPLVKENRDSFFQSCIIMEPSYLKKQERTKDVKKDFFQTFEKSNRSKCENDILEANTIEKGAGAHDTNKQDLYNTKLTSPAVSNDVPIGADVQSDIGVMNETSKTDNDNISKTKNTSAIKETFSAGKSRQLDKQIGTKYKADECTNDKIFNKKILFESLNFDGRNDAIALNENDGLEIQQDAKLENRICNVKKKLLPSTDFGRGIESKVNSYAHKTKLELINLYPENSTKRPYQFNEKKLHVPKTHTDTTSIDNAPENDIIAGKKEVRKKIIQKLSAESPTEERTRSPSIVTTNTTLSNGDCSRDLDIYDKLDSESATDSENSFHVNEKKSQVISIADLTDSAEDLARLDQICRIIETSDELSDRLFSVLDNNDEDFKNEDWSFKDLCERLKLDDFCNNVFGQS